MPKPKPLMPMTAPDPLILHYARYVAKGVRFLNSKVPGWTRPNKLAISDLDLRDIHSCVLGQLAAKSALTGAGYDLTERYRPDFWDAEHAMQIKGSDYGFNLTDPDKTRTDRQSHAEYDALNHLWAHAIRLTRRGEKVTVARLKEIA